jgi:superfamily II DNA or RNA helicase
MDFGFRYYQIEADEAIFEELQENNKCLVKMFCGTGKSKLMRYCRIAQNKKLVVYVVPSLSLLEQFYADYLQDFPLVQRISSEEGSTTESEEIINFLKKDENKIICITYQSFKTLIHLLGDSKIDVCIFDEAHHVVGKTYQSLIFETDICEKQIFFTATPKNENGVIMCDKYNLETGMCGNIVYDYSYFRGVMEGYLNPFEIRLDFYTENTVVSVYESIARAVLASGNSRILTFHADVNNDRDASVLRFVDEQLFIAAFNKVLITEFPEKIGYYKNIQMIDLTAKTDDKTYILSQFDTTPDDEVIIISSCRTIGEGIDTKNANMCVFVDPKSSFIAITQNIGRIVRKNHKILKPNSTILIACWVDKTKYLAYDGDKDKCDEVIREDMNKEGNFNGILNVMSALKQESEDLFDACLNYPSTYSPQEIEGNLAKYGYQLEEPVSLVESLEHLLDVELDIDLDEETDEDMLLRVADENNVTIEVHSNSLETPIEYYGLGDGSEDPKEVIRIFKSEDEETEETVYQPIVKKDGSKRNTNDPIEPLRRENRFNVKVHTNPDVKVLWNLSSDLDLSKDICSCIIDCEVVDMWPQRFEELKAFIDENERRPSNHSKIQEEKQLGSWLSNNSHKYKNKIRGMKDMTRYDIWTKFLEDYKKYFTTKDDLWFRKFLELNEFINANEKLPIQRTSLGNWISCQKQNYKNNKMDVNKYSLWTQFLEEYKQYILTDDEKWFQQFEALQKFIDENKKRPSENPKNVEESKLCAWLGNQMKNYKHKTQCMKDEMRYNLWTQFLEKYNEYFIANDEIWIQTFIKLKEFMDKYEKKPSQHSTDINEKSIANWINTQQQIYKNNKMNANRQFLWSKLLEEFKEYFPIDNEKWFLELEDLKKFIYKHNRRPSEVSKNLEEKCLNKWVSHQITDFKKKTHGMKDETRYNLWSQFLEEYEEYFVSDQEKWSQKFKKTKTFIILNKKKPSTKSKNIEEKQLGQWIGQQQNNYKNKIRSMRDDEQYNLWTQFLEEYKEYFVTKIKEEASLEEIEITVKPKQKKSTKLTKINPNPIKKVETKEDVIVRTKPLISQFHNKFCKMRSDNLANHFQQNPNDFIEYHRVRDECFQTFEPEDIPCNRVIAELNKIKKAGKHVVDMGCGTAKIAQHFKDDSRFQITSYDHVAINDTVQVCDISHMPLEDKSVDICIMSLALWGSNCEEYVRESLRILDENGILYIIDSTKRWSEEGMQDANKLKTILEANGFQIKEKDTRIDKWCYFKCVK